MESITGALGPLFLLILLGAVLGYWRWPSDTFWMTRKTMQESEFRAISHINNAELATQNANSILAMGMMNAFLY